MYDLRQNPKLWHTAAKKLSLVLYRLKIVQYAKKNEKNFVLSFLL
jgi:hypothetical protein